MACPTVLRKVAILAIRWHARACVCYVFYTQFRCPLSWCAQNPGASSCQPPDEEVLHLVCVHQHERVDLVVCLPHARSAPLLGSRRIRTKELYLVCRSPYHREAGLFLRCSGYSLCSLLHGYTVIPHLPHRPGPSHSSLILPIQSQHSRIVDSALHSRFPWTYFLP